MFWPFNIPAKRREREAQQRRDELQRIKDDIEAENRRQRNRDATISQVQGFRSAAAVQRHATLRAVPPITQTSAYDDPLSLINPLSPVHQISQFSTWSVPDEPRRTPSHCDTSSSHSSHSSSDYSSSHSSHDHSCSSSSYDTSSSYDSGSSSSSSDF